jgi:diguanylate cyclase (GGDEF)-like protein
VQSVRFSLVFARWAGVAMLAVGPVIALGAALSGKSEASNALIAAIGVLCLALAGVAALLPVRPWFVVVLPVVAIWAFAICAEGTGAEQAVATLPLLYAAAFLRLAPSLPTFVAFAIVSAEVIADRSAPVAIVLLGVGLRILLALVVSAGAEAAQRRLSLDRARAALAAASTPAEAARCLEDHLIAGEIVAAALAVVDQEPPQLAEWVADAGAGASFEPGRTIRIGPRDVIAQAAVTGVVDIDITAATPAADELRRRRHPSALALALRSPEGLVGVLILGGRRARSFRGRRRERFAGTALPLADAFTSMLLRHERDGRARLALAAREVTTRIAAAPDEEALWDALLGGLRRMFGADRAWIARRSESEPGVIVGAAADGAPRTTFRIDTTHESSLTLIALGTTEPQWVPDLPRNDARHRALSEEFRHEAALFLPLADPDGSAGVAVLHFDRPRLLRDHELEIAAALAREAGLAFGRLDAERRLRLQATRDPLTGLLNHGAFHATVAETIARVSGRLPVALVLVDLDHLKFVNDAFGHAAGDDALRGAAGVLEACARRDDVLGRLGGDEFGWLLPGATPDDAVAAAERALRLASTVDMATGGGTFSLTAGIAVALTAVDGDTLFDRADGALREGKLAGRGVARLVGADGPRRRRVTEAEVAVPTTPVTSAESIGEAAELAVVEWSAVFRSSACALSLIEGEVLQTVAFCAGLTIQPKDEDPYLIADFPVTADALATGSPRQVRADDLNADPAEVEVMRLNDARTLLIVPLIAGDEAVGLMELYDARPRVFSSDEQRLALALGRYLAATLQRLATR